MSKRILLIDDEDDIREIVRMSLEHLGGYDVAVAADGAEGLEAARRRPPDAVLLDVMMPGMDGPTTFAKLRASEATRGIPVVMLTAKVQANERQRLLDLGVHGVIDKPFDPLTLPQQVTQLLTGAAP